MEQTKKRSRPTAALVLVITLTLLLLVVFKRTSPLNEISKELGIQLPATARILSGDDNHGGFHGDGYAWYEIDTAGASFDPHPKGWHSLPLYGDARAAFYGGATTIGGVRVDILPAVPDGTALPEVANGCWFFLDRQGGGGSVFDESRFSANFTAALYDTDTGILYYLKLDS